MTDKFSEFWLGGIHQDVKAWSQNVVLGISQTQNPLGLSSQPQKQLACACPTKNDQEWEEKKHQKEDYSISQHACSAMLLYRCLTSTGRYSERQVNGWMKRCASESDTWEKFLFWHSLFWDILFKLNFPFINSQALCFVSRLFVLQDNRRKNAPTNPSISDGSHHW